MVAQNEDPTKRANMAVAETMIGRRVEILHLTARACLIGLKGIAKAAPGDLETLPRVSESVGGLDLTMVSQALASELCENPDLGADLYDLAELILSGKRSEAEKKS